MNARDYLQNTVAGFLHSIIEPLEALITSDETNRKRLDSLEKNTRAMDECLTAANETFATVNNHNAERITALEEYNRTNAGDIANEQSRLSTAIELCTVDRTNLAALNETAKATVERVTLAMERIEILENKHDLVSIAQFLNRLELAETCQERQRVTLENLAQVADQHRQEIANVRDGLLGEANQHTQEAKDVERFAQELADTQSEVADLRRIIGNHISAQNDTITDKEALECQAVRIRDLVTETTQKSTRIAGLEKQRRLDQTSLENLRTQVHAYTNQIDTQRKAIRELNSERDDATETIKRLREEVAHLTGKVCQLRNRQLRQKAPRK